MSCYVTVTTWSQELRSRESGGYRREGFGMNKNDTLRFSSVAKVAVYFLAFVALTGMHASPAWAKKFRFQMVRSPALDAVPDCVPNASGSVSIQPGNQAEILRINVKGLPPKTNFDFFVIQVPNGPFGMSWYQGDLDTNGRGVGHGKFVGRFNIETFMVAPGVAPAPLTFDNDFPSVSPNPQTGPIQMYHLGLWFNSPNDAANAGCPNTVTPFNGEHNAGVQILNTSNFPDLKGPLINVK